MGSLQMNTRTGYKLRSLPRGLPRTPQLVEFAPFQVALLVSWIIDLLETGHQQAWKRKRKCHCVVSKTIYNISGPEPQHWTMRSSNCASNSWLVACSILVYKILSSSLECNLRSYNCCLRSLVELRSKDCRGCLSSGKQPSFLLGSIPWALGFTEFRNIVCMPSFEIPISRLAVSLTHSRRLCFCDSLIAGAAESADG